MPLLPSMERKRERGGEEGKREKERERERDKNINVNRITNQSSLDTFNKISPTKERKNLKGP